MTITDQIGNLLTFDQTPQRIISLVPSQTELLVDLGLRDQIVGITKFCVHPHDLRKERNIVGGTKQVHYNKIAALKPDIILCNKEENTKEIVEELQNIAPVHVSDIKTVNQSSDLILQYGTIFKKKEKAKEIIEDIEKGRGRFRESLISKISKISVGYFIWKEPYMVAGSDTFINHLLEEIGFDNAFTSKRGRYPEVTLSELKELDYIFLSSEPFPFKEEHFRLFTDNSSAKVILVNGEFFSWYGSRLIKAYPYFEKLLSDLKLQEF